MNNLIAFGSPEHNRLVKGSAQKLSGVIATQILNDPRVTTKTVHDPFCKQTVDVNSIISLTIAINVFARGVPCDTRSTEVAAGMTCQSGNALVGSYFQHIVQMLI